MSDCTELLKWASGRLGLRWAGFRNVRGQVCKRISTELDPAWRAAAFDEGGRVRDRFRPRVRFLRHDLRVEPPPPGPFDLILCRNLAFTYFGEEAQRDVVATFRRALRPDGVLVVGKGEGVPDAGLSLVAPLVYRP